MIKITNLKKNYITKDCVVEALKGVSFDVKPGEFVAIMGESGSGKSTLLNCIGLMDFFDDGEYELNGSKINGMTTKQLNLARRNNISFIFQNYELMRNYSVYENIEVPLLAKNMKFKLRKNRIEEVAEKLNIAEYLKNYPYQLSGGQQQRVAIARAMVSDNPLILADEPTGALDRKNSTALMEYLLLLKNMSKTILMVTHDKNMAEYSERIIYIEDGKIV